MVNDLIISDSKNEVTLEAHTREEGLCLIMHNNTDSRSILDYDQLNMSIDRGQAHLLMLWLQEKLGFNPDINKRIETKTDYWYCKNCRTLHKKDYVCTMLSKEVSKELDQAITDQLNNRPKDIIG
jgi:hypothetical protein